MNIEKILVGKEITHTRFGAGTIQSVNEKNAVIIKFADQPRMLTVEALLGELVTFKDGTVLKELEKASGKEDLSYQKTEVDTSSNANDYGMKVLSLDDDIRGEKRDQLLSSIFGVRKWPGQTSYWNMGHGYYIWLPCLSEYYKGKYHATDANKEWINYFEDDNQTIIMESAIGEPLEQDGKHDKTFVFTKEKGEYIYRGVFEKDLALSDEKRSVSHLVETETDLTPWKEE